MFFTKVLLFLEKKAPGRAAPNRRPNWDAPNHPFPIKINPKPSKNHPKTVPECSRNHPSKLSTLKIRFCPIFSNFWKAQAVQNRSKFSKNRKKRRKIKLSKTYIFQHRFFSIFCNFSLQKWS